MDFFSLEHREKMNHIIKLWESLHEIEKIAADYGIDDIFQDNGAKVLQQLIFLNMQVIPGREGNDAVSPSGIEWEMKSINLETSATGFSTNHHTTYDIIAKYRKVPWTFAIYYGIQLHEIYIMTPKMLEPLYLHWEEKLKTMPHLNNPKIPVRWVKENGIKVFPIDPNNPISPEQALSL